MTISVTLKEITSEHIGIAHPFRLFGKHGTITLMKSFSMPIWENSLKIVFYFLRNYKGILSSCLKHLVYLFFEPCRCILREEWRRSSPVTTMATDYQFAIPDVLRHMIHYFLENQRSSHNPWSIFSFLICLCNKQGALAAQNRLGGNHIFTHMGYTRAYLFSKNTFVIGNL
ncbi:hypothetical protein SDC9_144314 [bioreactor metagenome]|uniref:Uncharacterized protein n=1 Tax=bioreactor metagenome TaxID=1076179 RepID=A0A645E6F8_9ZZZZ